MLLSWLGATLAYSPECLTEVAAGDRGILPSPIRLPPVKQPLGWAVAAAPMYRLELALQRAGLESCVCSRALVLPSSGCSTHGLCFMACEGSQEEGMAQAGMHTQVLCHCDTNLVSQQIRLQRQEGFFMEKELELLR